MGTRIEDLENAVQPIAAKLAKRWGIKKLLSASVLVFSRLTLSEQAAIIDAVQDDGETQRILLDSLKTEIETSDLPGEEKKARMVLLKQLHKRTDTK